MMKWLFFLCFFFLILDHSELEFRFAVIDPTESWCFPSALTESGLNEAKQVGVDKAVAEIVKWNPDVIHSHLNCLKGQTSYRYVLRATKQIS